MDILDIAKGVGTVAAAGAIFYSYVIHPVRQKGGRIREQMPHLDTIPPEELVELYRVLQKVPSYGLNKVERASFPLEMRAVLRSRIAEELREGAADDRPLNSPTLDALLGVRNYSP